MALDRFVYWKKLKPSQDDVYKALEDYLGDMGKIEYSDRAYVTLPGTPTSPSHRQPDGPDWHRSKPYMGLEARWFEVYYDKTYVDVITRSADELTNVIAEGFAEFCKRYWQGKAGPK